jgi:hypothetical protein
MPEPEDRNGHDPSHWAHYATDDLRQLLESLEALKQKPLLTIAGVKTELERRRSVADAEHGSKSDT